MHDYFLEDDQIGKLVVKGSNCNSEEWEWDDLMMYVTKLMGKTTNWYAESKNFGWRGLDGHAVLLNMASAHRLITAILPNTDCTFEVYKYGKKGMAIRNWHHDSPTGNEWYYIVPLTNKITKIVKR